jgi:glycosyltransferase involved in cell wall biosynthesis
MLIFLANEPTAERERDGMSQRVRWVDEKFCDVPRVILSISPKRNFRRKRLIRSSVLTVEEVNVFIHFPRILYLALRSDVIYVHSCFHALRALPLYFLGLHIVTDMHGVVPEELRLAGKPWVSRLMSIVEEIVVKRSTAIVFVTDAMRGHFKNKYSLGDEPCTYVIPILTREEPVTRQSRRDPKLVIYAGGLHVWQRIDQMLDAVEQTKREFKFLFLTGEADRLRSKLNDRRLTEVGVDSVPKARVFEYYGLASLGFILREDCVINRVACPTKLVEYMWAGVVPIVEQPFIGDFDEKSYEYILVNDFVKGCVPKPEDLDVMREHNLRVAQQLEQLSLDQFTRLRNRHIGQV